MRASEAVRKAMVTVTAETPIMEAATLMNQHAVGSVVVVSDGRIVGIVTDRDLVIRGVASGMPADARIDAVMTSDVITLDADADVRDALPIFRSHGFRRLPVVDGTGVIGVLSVDDLLINVAADLADLVRPITGEVIFGYPEAPRTPRTQG
jgi:CBS domain-containing protein